MVVLVVVNGKFRPISIPTPATVSLPFKTPDMRCWTCNQKKRTRRNVPYSDKVDVDSTTEGLLEPGCKTETLIVRLFVELVREGYLFGIVFG